MNKKSTAKGKLVVYFVSLVFPLDAFQALIDDTFANSKKPCILYEIPFVWKLRNTQRKWCSNNASCSLSILISNRHIRLCTMGMKNNRTIIFIMIKTFTSSIYAYMYYSIIHLFGIKKNKKVIISAFSLHI